MKFAIGKKVNMTQIFDESGEAHPVTAIKTDPITVTQIKNLEKDGYIAVQVAYGVQKEKRLNKPILGHYKGLGVFEGTKEFRPKRRENEVAEIKVGDKISVDSFSEGDVVAISGISKGKGFQGGVKRHGFHGGPRSHGQKHSEREVGSIGATGPQRVFKGTRMPGRMGGDRVTVRGLKIVKIDKDNNTIYVKGAVPGRRGTLLEIVSH